MSIMWGALGSQLGTGLGQGIQQGYQNNKDKTILESITGSVNPQTNPLRFYEAVMTNPDLSDEAKQQALATTNLGISEQNAENLARYRQQEVSIRQADVVRKYQKEIDKKHNAMITDLASTYFPKIAKNGALWLRDNYPAIKSYLQTKYGALAADLPDSLSLQDAVHYYNVAKTWQKNPPELTPYQKEKIALEKKKVNLAEKKQTSKGNEGNEFVQDAEKMKDLLTTIRKSNIMPEVKEQKAVEAATAMIAKYPKYSKQILSLFKLYFPRYGKQSVGLPTVPGTLTNGNSSWLNSTGVK